jgi:DNA-binding transcriptional MerR regulator
MNISEVAAHTQLSVDTIRFHEKSGICPPIARDPGGRRRFSAIDLDWFILLAALRETGMPIRQMRQFAQLYQSGDATIAQRKHLLLQHREQLEIRKLKLKECKSLLDKKLALYDRKLGEPS